VAIFVNGWYNKPTWDDKITPIHPDNTWACDITLVPSDLTATKIAAFLIALPQTSSVPDLNGDGGLPATLFSNAVAYAWTRRLPPHTRKVAFAGFDWVVKSSADPMNPGTNYFSDSNQNVWVDNDGLHLQLRKEGTRWYCSEVFLDQPLGYGWYIFRLGSAVDRQALDPRVVLGLFTYEEDSPMPGDREIDFEFSRWNEPGGLDAQYVVQPHDWPGHRYRFDTAPDTTSTHAFLWTPGRVSFVSANGYERIPAPTNTTIRSWAYTGTDVPRPGLENVRINLWLTDTNGPSNGQPAHVVIKDFQFVPAVWSNAVLYPNRWASLPWFGYFALTAGGWIRHLQHGWACPVTGSTASLWLFSWDWFGVAQPEWVWTSDAVYPWIYRWATGCWMYYLRDSQLPRWFYNSGAQRWEPLFGP
jgi:hypothetical protein